MKKKVLFLVNHDVVIYNFRKELVERLLSENYQVIISSPYGERIDYLINMGCKYVETKIERHGKNPFSELRLFTYYKKLIKEIKPDVVLTYTVKPNIYGGLAAIKNKVPYITNITGLGTAVENKGLMQKIIVGMYRFALKEALCVFFQNNENKDFFINKGFNFKSYDVIPGSGVNIDYFSLLPYPSDKSIEFLFISRIMKEKGIDQYLEAAEFIKRKYPNTVFHVLGFCEEDYEGRLKKLEGQGIIKYHGMQRDVRQFHQISHCTIHPTYYPEGMSNVLLESAASGRPIITTGRSGCREIVDDGVNGYIVEQKNSNDLIKKIEKFLELSHQHKEKMGIEGRKKVEKEFDRRIVVDRYLKVMERI